MSALTTAEFLRRLANRSTYAELSLNERERLREIAQEIEDEREILAAVADMRARIDALPKRPAPDSLTSTEPFTLPPVDPLESIAPTFKGKEPS